MASHKPLFTKTQLKELADERSWERGTGYFTDKRVTSILEDRDVIVAKVLGTQSYRVTLHVVRKRLAGECTCPMGDDGVFCKHCVATGLAYLDDFGDFKMTRGRIVRQKSP